MNHPIEFEKPQWYIFSLLAEDGSVCGRGRIVATSHNSAERSAHLLLAGRTTVRVEGLLDEARCAPTEAGEELTDSTCRAPGLRSRQ